MLPHVVCYNLEEEPAVTTWWWLCAPSNTINTRQCRRISAPRTAALQPAVALLLRSAWASQSSVPSTVTKRQQKQILCRRALHEPPGPPTRAAAGRFPLSPPGRRSGDVQIPPRSRELRRGGVAPQLEEQGVVLALLRSQVQQLRRVFAGRLLRA